MFRSILHRTILWELVRVFLLSLLGITGMLLMAGIVAEASQRGLSPMQILAAIPLLIPSTLPYTLPATTLFATCVVYGRLAHDNEILAIKSAGINILSVLWPAMFLGVVVSAVTMFLFYDAIPSTRYLMRVIVLQDMEEFLYTVLKREHCISHPKLNYTIYVRSVQGRTLIDAIFERKDPRTGVIDITARADEAEIGFDKQRNMFRLHLQRCYILASTSGDKGYFLDRYEDIPLPPDFDKAARKFKPSDMTWQELIEFREESAREKNDTDTKMAVEVSIHQMAGASAESEDRMNVLRNTSRLKQSEIRGVDTEMLMRPALSLGCLCFVVIGCPVGIWFSKSDYLSAFITCFLPIVIVYYPLLLCGSNLAKNGRIPVVIAVWGANALMAIVALPLYRKLVKN